MNNKKKQTAVVAMATVLSVTSIASPLPVMAQEDTPAPPAIMQEEKGQQKTAPDISLPENLQATAGTALEEITLPEHWSWEDKSTVITTDTTEYPARFSVDDVTYDYSNVEGYNEKGHYVERMVTVTVEPAKPEPAEPVQEKSNRSLGYTPTAVNAGDIEINETNFPNKEFRDYITSNFDIAPADGKLTSAEIAGVERIDVVGNTKITNLIGIEYFTALESLNCSNTGITSLDVSKNKTLHQLTCNNNANLESLTVAGATELTTLSCFGTGITSLDVSNNTKLTRLDCSDNAKLANLTVAGATELTRLDCSDNAKLANLTVAGATELTELYCSNTGITSLDVSQNALLTYLNCDETPLAYLNIETNPNLIIDKNDLKPMSLEITEDSFNMADKFAGIDVYKISSVVGAIYINGIMSNYDVGTPITYTYTCGTSKNGMQTIDVTLNLTDIRVDSTISITENLSKTYDKTAVNATPNVSKTGSSGAVSFTWEQKKSATDWEQIASAPTDAGTYRVTANLASDSNYKGATSAPVEFTISQADSTISITENLSKTYDKTAVNATPNVSKTGSSGAVSFTWEQKKSATDWEQITSVPTDAGTYRVTANLASDNNYKGATSASVVFTISQADSTISVIENLSKTYDKTAVNATPNVSKTGSSGAVSFTWEQKKSATDWEQITSAPTDAGTYRVTANLASDSNYKGATSASVEFTISQAESTISVTDDLDKTYDKTAVNATPNVNKTGSSGAVSYMWERKKNATEWEQIASAPTDAGTYRVTANLASDINYKGATSAPVEFTISQAEPSYTVPQDLEVTFGQTLADVKLPAGFSWTDDTLAVGNAGKNTFTAVFTPDDTKNYKTVTDISVALTVIKADNALKDALSLEGWTYGDTPAVASAGFRFGKPRFLYSDKADGTYTETVPTNAGTWYVKAVVDGTDNYEGAESDAVSFVIAPNDVTADSQITVPDITADTNLDELVIKDGDVVLAQGADYDVAKTQDGNKVTVTFTFKGNYTGTITRSYTVEEKTPAGGDKDDKKAVETGDTTSLGLWSSLLAFSAGIAVFLKRKKQQEETEE